MPDDEESDDEAVQQICNMIGESWEQFPYPIFIDSGACASVMPTQWCSHVPLQKTPQSEAGEYFNAANGQRIYNEGNKRVTMMTREGTMRDMIFTVCGVSKALGSVSQMCRAGHRVAFNPPGDPNGSYIEHVAIGECMWFEEQVGLYVLNTKVAPTHKQTGNMMAAWKAQQTSRNHNCKEFNIDQIWRGNS